MKPKGHCLHCGELVLANQTAAYRVYGWEIERGGGGANQIRGRQRLNQIVHARYGGDCLDRMLKGDQGDQMELS